MKKLFFLCAFLFMSMQMEAQMYVVAYVNWSLNQCEFVGKTTVADDGSLVPNRMPIVDDNGVMMCGKTVEIIIAPDGSISKTVIPFTHIPSNLDLGSIHGLTALQQLSSTFNNIIEKGYTLLPSETRNWDFHMTALGSDDNDLTRGLADYKLYLFVK